MEELIINHKTLGQCEVVETLPLTNELIVNKLNETKTHIVDRKDTDISNGDFEWFIE